MINWWMVFVNGLWIIGLSILLATFSYHDWLARETGEPRSDVFKAQSWRLYASLGMFLTCVGWGLSQTGHPAMKALWLLMGAWFGWQMLSVISEPQST